MLVYTSVSLLFSVPGNDGNASRSVDDGFTPLPSLSLLRRWIIPLPPASWGINRSIQIATSQSSGQAGSDAGRCTFQDGSVCRLAFWGGWVHRLGPNPRRKFHQGHEHSAPRGSSGYVVKLMIKYGKIGLTRQFVRQIHQKLWVKLIYLICQNFFTHLTHGFWQARAGCVCKLVSLSFFFSAYWIFF